MTLKLKSKRMARGRESDLKEESRFQEGTLKRSIVEGDGVSEGHTKIYIFVTSKRNKQKIFEGIDGPF